MFPIDFEVKRSKIKSTDYTYEIRYPRFYQALGVKDEVLLTMK